MSLKSLRFAFALLATSALAVPAAQAKDDPTPEQRIKRLEKQVRQVQKVVFPKGQPADSAGLDDTPAATQDSVTSLTGRLDAVERQMADLVRQTEENGNRLSVMEADVARMRADTDRRLREMQSAPAPATDDAGVEPAEPQAARQSAPPPAAGPKYENGSAGRTATATPTPAATPAPMDRDALAEAAYDAGFQLWNSGKYAEAVTALNKFAKDYPGHRRASWARNLAGRALLDKGDYRKAAEVLLANYRGDPKGERAQDSVFYLGQALMKLGQPGQACKAYAELEDVYAGAVRAPLVAQLPAAKAEARCG